MHHAVHAEHEGCLVPLSSCPLELLDASDSHQYDDAVPSRDIKYSQLVVLTGAGASKPCGLPDMLEFAEQFRHEVIRSGKTSPAAILIDAIYSAEGAETDLEALMTTLMSLSGEGNDAATDLLLERGENAEKELTEAIEETSYALKDWLRLVPYGDGPFDVVVPGALSLPATLSPPVVSEEDVVTIGEFQPPELSVIPSPVLTSFTFSSGITKDEVERHKKLASRARSISKRWSESFGSIRRVAPELLKSLKEQIQNTYSKFSLDRALVYQPLIEELTQRFSYLDIFTLNYDTVIERVLAANQKQCSTGFTTTGERTWSNTFPKPAAPGSVRLFKLHGSVNWFKVETNVIEMPHVVTAVTTTTGQAQSMLIYPITHKVTYDEPHLTLLHHFSRGLRAAKFCLIIGCSLRDDVVSSALAFAARDRRDLQFIFCGSGDRIKSNHWLKRFSGRFRVMRHHFGEDDFLGELKGVLDELAGPQQLPKP